MFEAIYQIKDAAGSPQGGRKFIAPDQASLDASVASCSLPDGWTMVQVGDESQILQPTAPPTPPEV